MKRYTDVVNCGAAFRIPASRSESLTAVRTPAGPYSFATLIRHAGSSSAAFRKVEIDRGRKSPSAASRVGMHLIFKGWLAAAAVALSISLGASFALAQSGNYPDRRIRVVVPFAAGGGVDVLARMFAERAQAKLGNTIIVDNRPGASGTVGGQLVMRSPSDGYTLLFAPVTHIMANQIMAEVPYDPVTDFTPVARVAEAPLLVVMSPKMPQKTLSEVIAAARENPQNWTIGVSGLGSASHLAALELNYVFKANLTIALYRGTAPALTDVMGGHIQLLIENTITLLPVALAGGVKPLAITGSRRTAMAPDFPTAAEVGFPSLNFTAWYGFWGPKGLPSDIVAKLNTTFNDVGRELVAEKRLAPLGIEVVTETPDEFARYIRDQVDRNGALLKEANFKPE